AGKRLKGKRSNSLTFPTANGRLIPFLACPRRRTMSRIRLLLGAALALAVLLPAIQGQEKDALADNPLYKYWVSFKPGAVCVRKEKVHYGPDGSGGIDEKDITYKLVQVAKDKVVVQVVVVDHDLLEIIESAPTRITYPARVKKSALEESRGKAKLKEGE